MPLHSIINHNPHTAIYIWKITEALGDLFDMAVLTDKSIFRLGSTRSLEHKRGFLSVRSLLQAAGYNDFNLTYDEFGKPHLHDGKHISISHSHEFSAIIISDEICGIDLEMCRDKIILIADKFVEDGFEFPNKSDKEDYIARLTVDWGIKESVFKIRNEAGISFKNHISVTPFEMDSGRTTAKLQFNEIAATFDVHFMKIENYILVYAFQDNA